MATAPAPQPEPQQPEPQQQEAHYDDITRLQGRGVVYRSGARIGETGYDLMILPPHHRRPALEPGNPPDDRPDITGVLTDRFYIGEDVKGAALTLMLEDGQQLEFKVLVPDTNEIVGIGPLHR
jgi:hypothetical protein